MQETLSLEDFATMREAGTVAAEILKKLKSFIRPKISTKNIEEFFEKELSQHSGMEPAFKGFMGYPASLCVSLNEEIIHGIPSKRLIQRGDLVSIDLGIKYRGLFVDTAYTYIVETASRLAKKLVRVSQKALQQGISRIKAGARIGDVGSTIQDFAEEKGFSVVRKFVGHGIGRDLHLKPEVPNFGDKGQGLELEVGSAIAVEPMITAGGFEVEVLTDGWTAKTKDNSLSAHFEHTVAITEKGPWVLTQ